MPKRILILLLSIFVVFILVSLFRQIIDALNAGNRLNQAVEEVTQLQQKNMEIKKRLAEAQSEGFKEKVLRDKLNMGRNGEAIVIIPDSELEKVLGAEKKGMEEIRLPNWYGWYKLFFR